MEKYEAYRYAADGHADEPGDGEVIATGTLEECRSAIFSRLHGYSTGWYWSGTAGDVEAYHESADEGCGGWAIRPARV